MEQKTVLETRVEDAAVQAGGLLRSRYGLWAVAGISFLESALLLPIITDPFLVAYILANKDRVYKGIVVTTVASIAGGLFSYAIAFLFYEYVIDQYLTGVLAEQFFTIVESFNDGVFWITLAGAVTPIPYTLVSLGAGFMKASLMTFLLASLIGRGGRYLLVGLLTYYFGEKALLIARRNILFISAVFFIAVVVYFVFFH
jgi:membrane protein YqaA with SNARE-associated domain